MQNDSEELSGHRVVIDSDVIAPRIYLGTKGKPTVVFYRLDNEGVDVPIYARAYKKINRKARYAGRMDLSLEEMNNITHEELLPIARQIYGARFVKHQIKRLIRIHYIDKDAKYEHRPSEVQFHKRDDYINLLVDRGWALLVSTQSWVLPPINLPDEYFNRGTQPHETQKESK